MPPLASAKIYIVHLIIYMPKKGPKKIGFFLGKYIMQLTKNVLQTYKISIFEVH